MGDSSFESLRSGAGKSSQLSSGSSAFAPSSPLRPRSARRTLTPQRARLEFAPPQLYVPLPKQESKSSAPARPLSARRSLDQSSSMNSRRPTSARAPSREPVAASFDFTAAPVGTGFGPGGFDAPSVGASSLYQFAAAASAASAARTQPVQGVVSAAGTLGPATSDVRAFMPPGMPMKTVGGPSTAQLIEQQQAQLAAMQLFLASLTSGQMQIPTNAPGVQAPAAPFAPQPPSAAASQPQPFKSKFFGDIELPAQPAPARPLAASSFDALRPPRPSSRGRDSEAHTSAPSLNLAALSPLAASTSGREAAVPLDLGSLVVVASPKRSSPPPSARKPQRGLGGSMRDSVSVIGSARGTPRDRDLYQQRQRNVSREIQQLEEKRRALEVKKMEQELKAESARALVDQEALFTAATQQRIALLGEERDKQLAECRRYQAELRSKVQMLQDMIGESERSMKQFEAAYTDNVAHARRDLKQQLQQSKLAMEQDVAERLQRIKQAV